MDLFEYQARELFDKHGVPVLNGIVARTPDEAAAAAQELGGPVVVVKAQVKTGGRGKAGGVKVARGHEEARAHAAGILGMDINGHGVERVMVAEGADIAQEYYASIVLDRSSGACLCIVSREGGVDIEQLAHERPEALVRELIDPRVGIDEARAAEIVAAGEFPAQVRDAVGKVLRQMWQVYRDEDATLVEINPLVLTRAGDVVAIDGKVTLDDNAAFRHPDHAALVADSPEDPIEHAAREHGLHYVRLEGEVGIIGNGAGLVMSTLDVVEIAGRRHHGVRPANFLDIGGGASATVMAAALEVVISDPQVRCVFVNVFGGITACDAVADGIVSALDLLGEEATKPLVVRLDGNRVEQGRAILDAANHPLVTIAETMDGGAEVAAELAAALAHAAGTTDEGH